MAINRSFISVPEQLYMKLVLPCILMVLTLSLSGQFSLINEDGSKIDAVEKFELEKQDNNKLMKENASKEFSALNFAEAFEVTLDCENNGSWESIPNDRLMWRMRVRSPGATSINLFFDKYVMPKNGFLIIYTSDKKYLAGPFTDFDNKTIGQLWSPIIPSDDIILQIIIPEESIQQLHLSIGKINHGYINSLEKSASQSCNLDVVCGMDDGFPEVENYRQVIRSVGLYSIEGTRICSGALINNTKGNCIPYFLTADHCGITNNNVSSVVVHWKYENQSCRPPNSTASGGVGNGSLAIFNSGAAIRASNPGTDMMLIELDNEVPVEAEPFFAGWNNSSTPAASAVCIHHPNADEKRISFENNPLSIDVNNENMWFVENWEVGTTEGGSSGGPLFNSDQQIIGQVFGGEASCNNNLWDIFGRFDLSWEGDGSSQRSLKHWLDPENSGITQMAGKECSALLTVNEEVISVCNINTAEYSVILSTNTGFSSSAELRFESEVDGINVTFSEDQIGPDQTAVANISVEPSVDEGRYEMLFIADEGGNDVNEYLILQISKSIPSEITTIRPGNEEFVGTQLVFEWQDQYDSYDIEVSQNEDFSNPSVVFNKVIGNTVSLDNLDDETQYYWRIRGNNACSEGEWNNFTFETGKVECIIYNSSDLPLIITEDDANTVISTIEIPENRPITDVNIISIVGKHSWVGDLQFRLESPSGSEIILLDQECERNRDFHIGFDDAAASSFVCPISDSMTHVPDFPLSVFIDELSGGGWKLKVLDLEEFDGGSFDSWSIEICTYVPKNTVSTDEFEQASIRTYPIPANDVIYIEEEQEIKKGKYIIYDAVGTILQNGTLEPSIDVRSLQSGIYFLQILSDSQIMGVEKIIISK